MNEPQRYSCVAEHTNDDAPENVRIRLVVSSTLVMIFTAKNGARLSQATPGVSSWSLVAGLALFATLTSDVMAFGQATAAVVIDVKTTDGSVTTVNQVPPSIYGNSVK